ncbi:MAG: DUF4363 family protein [Clostridia bacterium]|nr:DUF4363 family protein [Clostridia bacterium]
MVKQSFKGMSAAVAAGIILSFVITALACIIPKAVTDGICADCIPLIDEALDKALENRNGEATPVIETIIEIIKKRRYTLLLFFDHKDVSELVRSAETALELSKTDDTAQLITELCDIGKACDYLKHINDMSILNIF